MHIVSVHVIDFFGSALASLLSYSPRQDGMPRNRQRKNTGENETKKRELHELPCTAIVKSGTTGLSTVGFQIIVYKQPNFKPGTQSRTG